MRPDKQKQMMSYLTRPARELIETGQLKFASDLVNPDPRKDVIEIDAINSFMKRNPRADGGRIEFHAGGDVVRLKALQADYDKFGKKELNKAAKTLGFEDYSSMMGEKNRNFRNKIKTELTEFGSVLPEKESRSRSRVEKRIPKEQAIQIKLLEETNKKKFFDPKAFAKENKISMATLKDKAKRLQTNIYKKRMVDSKTALGIETKDKLKWIPKESKFSDNALTKLWKSKLITYDRNRIDNIFFDAFGRKPTKTNPNPTYNPKKFLAIKKNLNEYRQLRNAINKRYPKINFELDHPLSKSTLNKVFNATTDQLTRVNILEADLNNGFKDSLSLQYEKAIESKNLTKKKAVEKITRDLKLNIGKVSDDATNFKYGVKEFQKLNIKNEMNKAIQTQADLSSNFKSYVKENPDLFKTAGINPNVNITPIGKRELTGMQKIIGGIGKGAKIAGKVIRPLGVGFGVNAVKNAIGQADDQGLQLNFLDKAMAFDSGDAEVALNNARRRVDPEFAAQERAKDLAQMTDDFEEVGQQPLNIDLTMPRAFNSLSSGGVASGPPPERGPNPQGLLSLMKRARNY